MFNKNERINNQNNIIKKIKLYLFKYTNNDNISGFIVFLIHWIITLFVFTYIFIGDIDIFFYLAVLIWIIIVFLHLYFNGCIFTKIERNYWKTNEWNGPWILLSKLLSLNKINFKNFSKTLQNIFYLGWGLFLSFFIILRLLLNKK